MSGSPEPAPPGRLVDLTAYPLAATDDGLPPGEVGIPPDFDGDWPDFDCGRPPELADLSSVELDALPFTVPARYSGLSWVGQPAGLVPLDAGGGVVGFADGGVLDMASAGLALAGFAEDAQARLGVITDDELVGVIRAWRRLTSWAAAREMEAIAALARRRPADGTPPASPGEVFPPQVSEFVPEEIAAALTLAPVTARREADLAVELAGRLGPVRGVLAEGWIDVPRARVFALATFGLAGEHAAAVVDAVLPQAQEIRRNRLLALGILAGQIR